MRPARTMMGMIGIGLCLTASRGLAQGSLTPPGTPGPMVKTLVEADAAKTAAAKPGETVNGLKLTLKADKTQLKMTPRSYRRASADSPPWWIEPTKLSFTFTNVSDKPVKIDVYDLDWSRLRIDVQGPGANSVRIVRQPINRTMVAPKEEDYLTLQPGKSLTREAQSPFPGVFAGSDYGLLKAGEYRVKATYSVPDAAASGSSPFEEGIWRGAVASSEIVLTLSLPPGETPPSDRPR